MLKISYIQEAVILKNINSNITKLCIILFDGLMAPSRLPYGWFLFLLMMSLLVSQESTPLALGSQQVSACFADVEQARLLQDVLCLQESFSSDPSSWHLGPLQISLIA
jgi:hypothetical protein